MDPAYLGLLGLAQSFLTTNTSVGENGVRCRAGGILPAIKCLGAITRLVPPPPQHLQARTHLQLASILYHETNSKDLAKQHCQQAWFLSQTVQGVEDVRFESASLLADIIIEECDSGVYHQPVGHNRPPPSYNDAKQILLKALEGSQASAYWHCRLLFQLANIHAAEKDYNSAVSFLGAGDDFAHMAGAYYARMFFLLSKAMLFLLERKFAEANPILHQTGPLIETWVQQNSHQKETVAKQQKEYLQMFFLVLQVCYYLMVGQVKSVKTVLKQLQQSIQTITAPGWPSDEEMLAMSQHPADAFQWLSKDHLCILVYLVTVMHSMQAGYMDKAQKYTDKAIAQIDKLRSQFDSHPILSSFHVLLLEHTVQCRLVTGNKSGAMEEVGRLSRLFQTSSPKLLARHRAQLHTMLGLYAMSMNCMEQAENQLNAALRTSQERELWTFANLNLAIVYVRTRREADFMALLDRISPDRLPSQSHSLQAAAYYIQGLQAFFAAKYNDAKRYLREALKMANAEDLNRLTSCSLVLLGHMFLSLGNSRESMNMVTPAMQLASKIPDVHVQLWASSILKDLYRMMGDRQREVEGAETHNTYSQTLLKDHFYASQLPEHNLIFWTDGPLPAIANTSSSAPPQPEAAAPRPEGLSQQM